jgi:hypothetical protein
MKKPCEKCYDLRVNLGWSGRAQITERGSDTILASAYLDRLLNDEFYPVENRPEDNLDAWPVCPKCGEKLPIDDEDEEGPEVVNLPDVNLTSVWVFLGFVFLGLMLLLLLF